MPVPHGASRLHQNVEPSEFGRCAVDGHADTVGIRKIGLERERDPAKRADLCRRRLGLDVPAVIDERHVGPPARKLQAHRAPDPAAAAGHQGLLVPKLALAPAFVH